RRAASPLEPWRRRTRRPARAARPGSWSSTDRRRAAATPLQVVPLPAAHEWFSCADAARRAWRGCFIRRAARYSRNVSYRVSDVVRGDLVVILVTPRSPSLRSLRLGVNQNSEDRNEAETHHACHARRLRRAGCGAGAEQRAIGGQW